jgi:hypothetical protein
MKRRDMQNEIIKTPLNILTVILHDSVTFCPFISILNVGLGGTVVKVLCYKSEGRWSDSSWCHWNSDRTMALGSTQPNRNE